MNFVRDEWKKKDFEEFEEYALTLKSSDYDCEWEKRIVNTNLPCFGRTSSKAKEVVREIKKGNFLSFIDNIEIKNMLDSMVVAFLLKSIKDYDAFEKRLKKFALTIDNWASCDTLRFDKRDKDKLLKTANDFLKSDKCFVRRVGVNIFFEIIKEEKYLKDCFEMLNRLKSEKEYYVNMCAAWLLSVCFVKYREETLKFFENNSTNDFIINKGISKCRDSYRVTKEDKDMLRKFRRCV